MSEQVKYWNITLDKYDMPAPYESEHGKWVKRKDHDALAAARDQYRDLSIKYGDKLSEVLKERDAALAELAALKGGREAKRGIWLGNQDWLLSAIAAWGALDFDTIDELDAHVGNELPDAPPAQASAWVPEGWEPVPIQMTESMLDAAWCACSGLDDGDIRDMWRAMLAAAPTPGASE